jgi:hypothetical protein
MKVIRRCLRPLLGLLLFLPTLAAAQPGTAPTGDPGGFGIDGDLAIGTPVAGTIDWDSIIMPNGMPTSSATLHGVDGYNNSDLAFSSGSSRLLGNPNIDWFWDNTGMQNPLGGKDNFSNGVAHFSRDANGHTWFTWAVDREGSGATSDMDVGLYQNPVVRNGNGTFSSSGPHGGHTVGDLLLSLSIFGAGSLLPPGLAVWRWSQTGPGTYDFTSLTPPAGTTFTAVNSSPTTVSYSAFGNGMYSQLRFAEASIDLSALLARVQPPTTFVTVLFDSRFGPEIGSALRDFIEPITVQITTGVDARVPPGGTRILGIRPNPGRGPVSIELDLAQEGAAALDFFDLAGRHVGAIDHTWLPAGRHVLRWEATAQVPPSGGVLFARLTSETGTDVRRFVLLP